MDITNLRKQYSVIAVYKDGKRRKAYDEQGLSLFDTKEEALDVVDFNKQQENRRSYRCGMIGIEIEKYDDPELTVGCYEIRERVVAPFKTIESIEA